MSTTTLKSDGKYAVVVQGLFEKSDSIGYDAIFQYKILASILGVESVDIFAENFDQDRYPEVKINHVSELIQEHQNYSHIIYHFCDGWDDFDTFIARDDLTSKVIVRWHNNTPHWFYAPYDLKVADRCVRGFENISRIVKNGNVYFWVNSQFTENQLVAIGANRSKISVVYPGSRYVEASIKRVQNRKTPDDVFRMLFVGRVVAHKGHLHCVSLAEKVHNKIGKPVELVFMGRSDKSAGGFNSALQDKIQTVSEGVTVSLHGEVDESVLREGYDTAHAFVCLSEHEGFGLPVFEAMLCGVPVISCARTALKELMSWHPLSVSEMDLQALANKVATLTYKDVEASIVSKQYDIVEQYNYDLIKNQIVAGIEFKKSPLLQLPLNKNIVDEVSNGFCGGDLFDYGENLVTSYDIVSMRAALEKGGSVAALLQETHGAEPRKRIKIAAEEFKSGQGVFEGDNIVFGLDAVEGHAIFGPYVRLPKGLYEVEFELSSQTEFTATFDVLLDGRNCVASKTMTVGSGPVRLGFASVKENNTVEFRVKLRTSSDGKAVFGGVYLARDGRPEQLASEKGYDFSPAIFASGQKLVSRVFRLNGKAKRYFKMADAARDKGQFAEAASLYQQGLNLAPHSRVHWIQLGNMLRDTGQPQEALSAYKKAAAIGAIDPDLHLQMGRAYADLGQGELSDSHLWASIGAGRSTIEALKEISKRQDVSVDEVVSFIG